MPSSPDRIRHLDAVRAAEEEILLAVAGRDMDEAGAGLGGDEIAEQQRHVVIVALPAQRMGADGAGQRRALHHAQHVMRGDPRRRDEPRQQRQRDQQLVAGAHAGPSATPSTWISA